MCLRRHTNVLKILWCFSMWKTWFFPFGPHWKENLPFSAHGLSFNLEFNEKAKYVLLPAEGQWSLSPVYLQEYQNSSVSQYCAWGFVCFHTDVSNSECFLYSYLETGLRWSLEYINLGVEEMEELGVLNMGVVGIFRYVKQYVNKKEINSLCVNQA